MAELVFSVGDFDYLVAGSEYAEQLISLVVEVFIANEPIVSCITAPKESIDVFFRAAYTSDSGKDLSIVCIHRPSQEICGGLIASKVDESPESNPELHPEVETARSFLVEMDNYFFSRNDFDVNLSFFSTCWR